MQLKHKLKVCVLVTLLLPLAITATTFAQEETNTTLAEETTTTTLEERLTRRKAEAQTRANAAEQKIIQARCKASQAHLHRLGSRILGVTVRRKQHYDKLLTHLHELSAKLQAKNITTTEYDAQIDELETKITALYTALDNYQEVVDDLATMDCAADPEGYKASLEEARAQRTTVVQDAQSITTYLQDTIKPTLQTVRQQIAGEGS